MSSKLFADTSEAVKTIAKGVTLLLWIFLLGLGALYAINGRASDLIINYFTSLRITSSNPVAMPIGEPAFQQLRMFLAQSDNPPPIAGLLDSCLPKWADQWTENKIDYFPLFQRASDRLWSCVTDPEFNIIAPKLTTDFIPLSFRASDYAVTEISLTPEVRAWIVQQKERLKESRSRISLVDTFVLLIIIGAFGSLIFLTRDYMVNDQGTKFTAYLFRPVLGVFLAVAMFVVTITANAAVSTSDILDVRRETLYILALAAGLLSDRAYSVIDKQTQAALAKFARDKQAREEQSSQEPSPAR